MEDRIRELIFEHDPQKARCIDGYWICPACGHDYGVFAPEIVEDDKDEFSHLSALLAEMILEYQAKAWDKGWAKGSYGSGIIPMRFRNGNPPDKSNRNPYRQKEA